MHSALVPLVQPRGEHGLIIVGAAAMAISAFLPHVEPTGAFRMVEDNTLIQHGGWMLIALAFGIAASGYRTTT